VSVKLYIEGGGEGQLLDTLFRQGWRQFFEAADLLGRMPGIVRGKGREQTFDMFRTAVIQARPGLLPLLLVDSEDPVARKRFSIVSEPNETWRPLNSRRRSLVQ
jgi:hypothetical protein